MYPPTTSGLAALTRSIFTSLGVGDDFAGIDLPRCSHAVLCLVDGLGADLLDAYAHRAPYLASLSGAGRSLRAGFPSTTASSLASLATAADSGGHGLVGAAFNLEDRLFNPLAWQLYDPRTGDHDQAAGEDNVVLSRSGWLAAVALGVSINAFLPAAIAGSSYTRTVFKGARVIPFRDRQDLVERFHSLPTCPQPQMSYLYFGELDHVGHLHGPGSEAWQGVLQDIDQQIQRLSECIASDTVLIVTADHGMTTLDDAKVMDFDLNPVLQIGVSSICADIRARHVYLQDCVDREVLARWRETLGEHFRVFTREEAVVRGLFGVYVVEAACARIGDLVVVAGEGAGLIRSLREPFQTSWVGHHGALTDEEQSVPLLIARGARPSRLHC
jgi:hypothetical protein